MIWLKKSTIQYSFLVFAHIVMAVNTFQTTFRDTYFSSYSSLMSFLSVILIFEWYEYTLTVFYIHLLNRFQYYYNSMVDKKVTVSQVTSMIQPFINTLKYSFCCSFFLDNICLHWFLETTYCEWIGRLRATHSLISSLYHRIFSRVVFLASNVVALFIFIHA